MVKNGRPAEVRAETEMKIVLTQLERQLLAKILSGVSIPVNQPDAVETAQVLRSIWVKLQADEFQTA